MKKNVRKLKELSDRIEVLENKVDGLSLTLKSIDESLKTLTSSSLSNELAKKMFIVINKALEEESKTLKSLASSSLSMKSAKQMFDRINNTLEEKYKIMNTNIKTLASNQQIIFSNL